MYQITRVGVDLAKNVLQVHAVNAAGAKVVNKALKREQFVLWCVEQLPAGCQIAIEATSGAHHWGRRLQALGFQVQLLAPHLVSPYRLAGKHGKNDANDAAAVCEAASRPTMRFVPIKSVEQQAQLAVHHCRQLLKQERTAQINQIRAVLTEFGLVVPTKPDNLRAQLHDLIEDASNEMTGLVRIMLQRSYLHWVAIDEQLSWCDEQITLHIAQDARARKAQSLYGVGPVTASAIIAAVVDFKQFKNGSQFGAWLGLTPKQHSSGGQSHLGTITKHGNTYLRGLLVQGAKSAVQHAPRRTDNLSKWIVQLKDRVGWQKTVVALANKNARILWAVMTKDIDYDPNFKSMKPNASLAVTI
jgi:transposase